MATTISFTTTARSAASRTSSGLAYILSIVAVESQSGARRNQLIQILLGVF